LARADERVRGNPNHANRCPPLVKAIPLRQHRVTASHRERSRREPGRRDRVHAQAAAWCRIEAIARRARSGSSCRTNAQPGRCSSLPRTARLPLPWQGSRLAAPLGTTPLGESACAERLLVAVDSADLQAPARSCSGGGRAPEFRPNQDCELVAIGGWSADRGERPGFGDLRDWRRPARQGLHSLSRGHRGPRLCGSAGVGSTGVGVRQPLGLVQSSIDQVEAEIPEAWVGEVEADHLAEPLWVA
jgi:hypothetical protein